jgi:UDP-4-amino-4,6-dideoxy-N-acetyl-beta-L-altrosamine N-acetyltransferase
MFTFREIETSDAKMILNWRTSPGIAKYMKTEVDHGVLEQEQWIKSCRERPDFYHWLIVYQEKPIGYISLSEYNSEVKTASWGFYIGEEEHAGLGGLVPPFFYRFCFSKLGIKRIDAEMLYFNTSVIDLHQLHGYEFTPERDRILKRQGKGILLVAMSLSKIRFEEGKFNRFSADFPTTQWHGRSKPSTEEFSMEEVTGTDNQIKDLYQLLESREHSISHEQMPSLETHNEFVRNHPYRKWWLVKVDEKWAGTVYLSQENSVGINLQTHDSNLLCKIIQQVRSENEPLPAISSVRPGFFYVNVAPQNTPLQNALTDLGAKLTQSSFRI